MKKNAKKVLILSHMFPDAENSVSGCFIHEQVKALREQEGIDARVVTCRPFWICGFKFWNYPRALRVYRQQVEAAAWTAYKGVPVMYLPYKTGGPVYPHIAHGHTYLESIKRKLDSIRKEFPFEVIHAHTAYLDGSSARYISKRYHVPYVLTEHTGPFSILTDKATIRRMTLKSIKKADRVWAVSDSLRETIAAHFETSKEKEHIEVLYNGVDLTRFKLTESKKNLMEGPINIMTVGYMEEVKNPLNLVRAFQLLYAKEPRARLKMVGDGTLYPKVKEMVEQEGLSEAVTLYGLRPREEVAELLRKECDIFVLPSLAETFGVVLIEALASGKPVVATLCGGAESIVRNGVGLLCENNDPASMCDALLKVINNYAAYQPEKLRAYANDNFSLNILAQKLSKAYAAYDKNTK